MREDRRLDNKDDSTLEEVIKDILWYGESTIVKPDGTKTIIKRYEGSDKEGRVETYRFSGPIKGQSFEINHQLSSDTSEDRNKGAQSNTSETA